MDEFVLPGDSGIRINLKVIWWWQPLYLMCKPVIEVGGVPAAARWGVQDVSLHSGTHNIRVYFPYLAVKECGSISASVVVRDGRWTEVTYTPPFTIFQPGKLRINQP